MAVPAESLGSPTSFLWSTFTEELVSADALEQLGTLGSDAGGHAGAAPDGGIGAPLAWPAS